MLVFMWIHSGRKVVVLLNKKKRFARAPPKHKPTAQVFPTYSLKKIYKVLPNTSAGLLVRVQNRKYCVLRRQLSLAFLRGLWENRTNIVGGVQTKARWNLCFLVRTEMMSRVNGGGGQKLNKIYWLALHGRMSIHLFNLETWLLR